MTKRILKPAAGRLVRTEDGRRHVREAGEPQPLTTYYARRLNADDLVDITDAAVAEAMGLKDAISALEQDNPDHFTESGKPDLNHLSDLLNRRVTRKEVEQTMKEMEA